MEDKMLFLKKSYFNGIIGCKWLLVLLFLFFLSFKGYAQNAERNNPSVQPITGYVFDLDGNSIVGASIKVKGTSIGTITDIDGRFNLKAKLGTTLEVSFIGYETKDVLASNGMKVILKESVKTLDEVVVVGYGSMKKSDLTGSVARISSKDFQLQPIMNSTEALMGRFSGVTVTNTSGNVNGSMKVRIRGANSINGGNDPLYVCDGIVDTGMPPVDDIESIEVLKDASATAIYGSRGANGVILITTKKGKEGATHIKVNVFGSFLQPVHLYNELDASEYAREINTLYNNVYSETQMEEFKRNGGTDWQKEILSNAWRQKYNVSISGGTPKVKYHIFGEYSNNTSMIEGQRSENYSLRSDFDINLFKNLQLEWHINGNYNHGKNADNGDLYSGGTESLLFNALTWGPTESVYNDDGSYNLEDQYGAMGSNPVQKMKEKNVWSQSFGISSNAALTWQILSNLSIQYRLNIALNNGNSYEWDSSDYTQSNAEAHGSKSFSKNIFQNLIINWNKSYGNHNITVTAVGESNKYSTDGLSGDGSYFGNENLGYWGMSTGTTKGASTSWTDWALLSGVGRINYNYARKYYITGAFRTDGSSKFAKGNKWGFFPSGSIAWRASEEDFIKDLNIFSNLKLRASYGKTGNQGVSPYSTIASLSEVGAYYTYTSMVEGYTSKTINKDLKWEETGQTDLGLDVGIFDNRLNLTFDYYRKNTKKLLLNVTTPYYLGGDDIYVNKGQVRNSGLEFSVNAIPLKTQDWYWDIQANISTNKNRIINLDGETIYGIKSAGNNDSVLSDETYILKKGLALGELYGYKWLGIWQENEAEEAAKYGNKPGDNKYEDLDKNYTINASDRTNIGNGTPKYTWGFNSTLKYKNWDLNVLMQGVHGTDKLNVLYAIASSQHAKGRTITLKEAWENSWTPENKSNRFPNVSSETSTNYINSTQWLQDASFIRLQNISLGYTFNKKITKIGDFHIYVSAQNLLTITKYKGFDPEATSTRSEDVNTGIDSGITPAARVFTFGAQLSF